MVQGQKMTIKLYPQRTVGFKHIIIVKGISLKLTLSMRCSTTTPPRALRMHACNQWFRDSFSCHNLNLWIQFLLYYDKMLQVTPSAISHEKKVAEIRRALEADTTTPC